MPKEKGPDLKKFMGKRLQVKLNGSRTVLGRLTGFDVFMNLTLEEAEESVSATETRPIGVIVIRGSSVVEMGTLDAI
jgi:small nuclear ribonucleoprotein G